MVDNIDKLNNNYFLNKIVKNFFVIGLSETNNGKIKYKDEDNTALKFVQNIDIIKKNMMINVDKVGNENVKWYISLFYKVNSLKKK